MSDYRTQTTLPRGLRDNNPADMQPPPGVPWAGTVGMDGPFAIFSDTTWGLRALARDLMTNIGSEGYDTITSLITKFAPPAENDTASYITAVSADTGIDANDQLGTDQDTVTSLMRAIVNHELGDTYSQQYVPDTDIISGYTMATSAGAAFQGAAITAIAAAQNNPMETVIFGAGIFLVCALLFGRKK
jgi:hypothetical protein